MISSIDCAIIEYLAGHNCIDEHGDACNFSYLSNTDGSIRWLYPSTLKSPVFLAFYSVTNVRAKIIYIIIRAAFAFRLSARIRSGGLKINVKKESRLSGILNKYPHNGYSIFMGTVGDNRKALIELHQGAIVTVFVKNALNETSRSLVNNEVHTLNYLATLEMKSLVVPRVLGYDESGSVELTNIKPSRCRRNEVLSSVHLEALSELYRFTNKKVLWCELTALHECERRIYELLSADHTDNSIDISRVSALARKLDKIHDVLKRQEGFAVVAVSHGDFTPWNMYSHGNRLFVYDWEMSCADIPIAYDLIHFIFQSNVLLGKRRYQLIYDEIQRVFGGNVWNTITSVYNASLNDNYLFYLLSNISYYLLKYVTQEDLHEQALWLLDVWESAVDDAVIKNFVIFNTKITHQKHV